MHSGAPLCRESWSKRRPGLKSARAGIRQGALAAGMGFLSKPFTPEALVRKAREMLDQPS